MTRLIKNRRGTAGLEDGLKLCDIPARILDLLNKYGPDATIRGWNSFYFSYQSPETDWEYEERMKKERALEKRRISYAKTKAKKAEASRIAKEAKEKEQLKELLAKYGSDV